MYKIMDSLGTESPVPDLDKVAALGRPIGVMQCSLTLVANALGERSGPLAGDVHETGITGDLIEHGQDALRFRQKAAVEIGFELQQGVVNSQPVVSHSPRNQVDVFLLPREPFEYLQKLRRGRIQRVVESSFVDFGTGFPAESLLAKVGDFPVDIQILALKMFQLRGKINHLRAQPGAYLERRRAGILVQLAYFVSCGV